MSHGSWPVIGSVHKLTLVPEYITLVCSSPKYNDFYRSTNRYCLFQHCEILALSVPTQKIGTTNKLQPVRLQRQGQLSPLENLAMLELAVCNTNLAT
ncbi:hypothetical protein L873DRAFT_766853 [Choiromyces venosus 120613-1]|uniref:Uncharacterized protein n=1 Tax=Choiromyces venosus 120613-1 TaxID=1336337 RepID=A0A3N4J509_9PEZI|nr:hypothetical protein L873DRAFT_766853 [Choiromyces venosus 120613-1]